MKKTCSTCRVIKSATEFRKDRTRPDGYHHNCTECARKKEEKWRNKNRKRIRERQRKHYKKNKESIKEKRRINYDPIKSKARYLARKIKAKQCILCDLPGERHHPDYSQPLDIIFLCKSHHKRVHDETIAL